MRRPTNISSVLVTLFLSGWMALVLLGCAQPSGQPRTDFGKEQTPRSGRAVFADGTLSASQRAKIDSAVANVLAGTGAPSASIAVVWDGRIVYEHAYGSARLAPPLPATRAMRYSIGSVSKQFTAAAVLLLAQEKRLSLDDKVGKWLPDLTRANDVSIRHLLSMTAGYQDYWPQDYVFPALREPTTPQGILDRWARKPLDFEPGTKWQYSNTNYVIAGLIVERASGMRLMDFLQQRIFTPLGMTSVHDADAAPLGAGDAAGWLRNALGPLRPAPKEGKGWLFAAGELAMTAHDLALWDISVIDRTILSPASYRTMQTDVLLESGVATRYGLGVNVALVGGRRQIAHGGAVSGYVTSNQIYPDERAAIVVFSNIYPGVAAPASRIAERVAAVIFEPADAEAAKALDQSRQIFADLQKGEIDRALFTPNANAYFSEQALADYASSLKPLGVPKEFVQVTQNLRGGMTCRAFRIRCKAKTLALSTQTLPDGRIEQYLIEPDE
jgi:D-alanyl-D-alanine carboxypeptidase